MIKVWETVSIEEANEMMSREPKRCIAIYTGKRRRCSEKNGYGAGERFCEKHREIIIIDIDSDCFFDLAPRYSD